nr:hypothetical protein CPGR_04020 [Mycolicibacterium fortuitum subsp. fortuitum DSM 46621 = ATCC 6841 = JCM 6387]CRL80659.1 hypothetical protein CPGR_03866 [Mycolicibacter nonchromogenicus]
MFNRFNDAVGRAGGYPERWGDLSNSLMMSVANKS